MAQSSIHAYCNEWNNLFGGTSDVVSLENLRRICVEGRLQGSRFRSICWRVLLSCLSCKKSTWTESARKWRQRFADLKSRHNIDPHGTAGSPKELQYNNPLSLDSKNPWQQYFDDAELRACIKQDVERTFPELEYFQSQSVRGMMIEILFLYARENPHIAYKQGMHEILGPLIFVLFFDHETSEHASKEGSFDILDADSKRLLSLLTDENHLEHDAYEMFTQIMLIIQPWYYFADEQQQQQNADQQKPRNHGNQHLLLEPFARVQDIGQSSVVVRKLNWIGDNLLKHSDSPLYHHLEKLDIPPQIYGIRWLRLLFGREFPIQDLLFLWDAIFADGPPLSLVDYIFVAMLVFIRDLLLDCDYTGCLHYLMRYPPVTDVNRLLAVALHLQNPQKYPKPVISSMQTNFSTITIAGRPHPNMQRQAELLASRPVFDDSSFGASVNKTLGVTFQKLNKAVMDGLLEPAGSESSKMEIPIVNSVDVKKPSSRQQIERHRTQQHQQQQRSGSLKGQRSENMRRNESPKSSARSTSPSNVRITGKTSAGGVFGRQGSLLSEEEVELLKEQISCLQVRLSDVEQLSHVVADKLLGCADDLSSRLASLNLPAEDQAHQSVAAMQQLCRILKGAESRSVLGMDSSNNSVAGDSPIRTSIPIPHKGSDVESIGSPMTMTVDGFNTPVEIGNDPTRDLSDFNSPRSRNVGSKAAPSVQQVPVPKQQVHSKKIPRVSPTRNQQHSRVGNDGGGAKHKIAPASGGGSPKLGAVNELKEISRSKPTASSNADE